LVTGLHFAQFFDPSLQSAEKDNDICAIIKNTKKVKDFDIYIKF
jgi:hypothetical protein